MTTPADLQQLGRDMLATPPSPAYLALEQVEAREAGIPITTLRAMVQAELFERTHRFWCGTEHAFSACPLYGVLREHIEREGIKP